MSHYKSKSISLSVEEMFHVITYKNANSSLRVSEPAALLASLNLKMDSHDPFLFDNSQRIISKRASSIERPQLETIVHCATLP